MKKVRLILLFILFLTSFQNLSAGEIKSLLSPNGKLRLNIQLSKDGGLSYSFAAGNRQFINDSPLGYVVDSHKTIPSPGWLLNKSTQKSVNSVWKPIWGKRAVVPDQYNELCLDLKGDDATVLNSLRLEARAYNDGVAFRYSIPTEVKNGSVASVELTKYNFSGDYTAWFYNGEHENLGPGKLSETNGKRMPVMTVKADKDAYLAIHEADLTTGDPLLLESKKGETTFTVVSVPCKLESGYH